MEFENTFQVQAPVEEVWDLLLDVERIAPCMPGASVLEQTGDDAYKVAVKVRLGPMTMNYKGDVEILDKDAGAHQATMRAKAKEARGQGTASASIRMALREQDGGTAASITTEMQMSGKAAAMGQGVIKDVAASLTDTFAQNLAALIDAGGRAASAAGEAAAPEPEVVAAVTSAAAPEVAAGAEAVSAGAAGAAAAVSEPAGDAALPVGKIIGSVVAGRLRDPKTVGVVGLLVLVLGVAIGRRRR
ncbi:MAG TPA: SRPBCC family protein [Baekduia sp.]|uniref:SRPBCC family protein n=1 Tax=Baekduia sp. TaxID=2600305 RepID=UPI002B841B13|nr:SRPBCC family protein [Baekduia sp.]HMJ36205.1 SRPBCC family protein [Baekduia sp.]